MPDLKGLEAFDEVKRLIVVAAHPDDLECVCGGVISLLVDRGVEVYSANCTLGDIGTQERGAVRPALATTRLVETEAAAKLLGIRGTYNLGHHDGELTPDLELRAQISRLYRITQADTLFTFDPYWVGQVHPDHRAAGQAALDAYIPSKMPLYRPEQLTENGAALSCIQRAFLFAAGAESDVIVDTSSVQPRKIAACVAHRSQFPKGEESLGWLIKMDARTGERIGSPAGEAFRSMEVW